MTRAQAALRTLAQAVGSPTQLGAPRDAHRLESELIEVIQHLGEGRDGLEFQGASSSSRVLPCAWPWLLARLRLDRVGAF